MRTILERVKPKYPNASSFVLDNTDIPLFLIELYAKGNQSNQSIATFVMVGEFYFVRVCFNISDNFVSVVKILETATPQKPMWAVHVTDTSCSSSQTLVVEYWVI